MGVPIVHFEIGPRDNEKTKQFYCELLKQLIPKRDARP